MNDGIVVGLGVGRLRSIGYSGSGRGSDGTSGGGGEARSGGRGGVRCVQRFRGPGAASITTLCGTCRQAAAGPTLSTPQAGVVTTAQTRILAAHCEQTGDPRKLSSTR